MASLLTVAPSTIIARLAAGDVKDATPVEVRSLLFDGASLTPATVAGTDKVIIQDTDDSDNLKTVTAQAIADLATGTGDVVGPASSTDHALARFDLATGKLLQDSLIIVTDAGAMTGMTTVDGRDLAVDGAKLDLIEALADVTDEANVTTALNGAAPGGVTVASGDKVLIQDITDADNLKTVTAQSIADLASGGFWDDTGSNLRPSTNGRGMQLRDGGGLTFVSIGTGGVIFNEQGASAMDFRVESDVNPHMFFVDAGNNSVHIDNNLLTGAGDGDLIMASNKDLRWINNGGTTSANQGITFNASDELELTMVTGPVAIGTFTPSHKFIVNINGTRYHIQLDAI